MRKILAIVAAAAMGWATWAEAAGPAHRLGGGVNYWVAAEDVEVDDIDSEGLGYVVSYQYKPGILGLGVDGELMPDRFGEDVYAPQAYLLLGDAIYAGAGIGILSVDGEWADDPFYSFRAGLDLAFTPAVHVDLYAQYRFESSQQLEEDETDIDTDTIYIGAALRLAF